MSTRRFCLALVLFGLVSPALAKPAPPQEAANGEARLLRFPAIQGDRLAFCYAGDIWTCSAAGGVAQRVTSFDEGYELYPRISPDGKWIAFSGEYSGTRQVFVVPYEGGEPKQLTFYPDAAPAAPRHGFDHLPMDWTPDGSKILVRACRTPYGGTIGTYYLVDPVNGGLEQPLGLPEGGPATYSPDGKKLAFNIISREWRTWKRYKAGRAQDVFLYDLEKHAIEQITNFEGTDNHPLWIGDRVYFTSDRTGTLNFFRFDLATRETKQVTAFTDFDALWPSRGGDQIAFELGGFVHVLDTKTDETKKLEIRLADDRPWLRPTWKEGRGNVGSFSPSPSAKRAVIDVRGELFTVPAKHGEARELTRTPGRRERGVEWSPDGRSILYLAEVGDDYEDFVRTFDGGPLESGVETQLTSGTGAWILSTAWSPDSKKIAFADKANRLSVVDVATKAVTPIDSSTDGQLDDFTWSFDSAWLAYNKPAANGFSAIWIAAAADPKPQAVTTDHYAHGAPAFDREGRYLFLLSSRDFEYDDLAFESRPYALLLKKDAASPIAPESDEEPKEKPPEDKDKKDEKEPEKKDETPAEPDKPAEPEKNEAPPAPGQEPAPAPPAEPAAEPKKDEAKPAEETKKEDEADEEDKNGQDKKSDKKKDEVKPVVIDFEGLPSRLVPLPLPSGNWFALAAVKGGFLAAKDGNLERYDLEKRELKRVLDGAGNFALTPDGSKILYRSGDGIAFADAQPGQSPGANKLPLDGVKLRLDRRVEWAQIYADAWRIMRDWFYDPQLHRVDWKAARAKYAPLVPHVAHRADLDFLLGEMIGELNVGHAYVERGDVPRVDRVPVGLLGCTFVVESERYRIGRIYAGENWDNDTRSPLTEPGVDAKEGDWLLSIDGVPLTAKDNPYRLLENKVGRLVVLTLGTGPTREGSRDVTVRPIASEQELRYRDWVKQNAEMVERLSGGRVGYVHVPNTAVEGHHRFFEDFRPQALVRDAILIDDRYNGGGFIPDRMAQALGARPFNYWARRASGLNTTPDFAFDGPLAMLINGYSSSGGDAFPFYFRKLGLGPLIGRKTWGGLVGYSFSPRFVDGGGLAVPSFAFVNTDGQWDVEAVGVAPDVDVFDDPTKVRVGQDPTIEKAIELLLAELEKNPPKKRPPSPEGPDRRR